MFNPDDLDAEALQEFIDTAQSDNIALAKHLYSNQPANVRTINLLLKYCLEKKELMKHASAGRQDRVRKIREKLDNIYSQLPDYSKWLE